MASGKPGAVHSVLQTKGTEYSDIGHEIAQRCETLGMRDAVVGLSCLHNESDFYLYDSASARSIVKEGDERWRRLMSANSAGHIAQPIRIELDELDELGEIHPRVFIWGELSEVSVDLGRDGISQIIKDYCTRAVQSNRAMLRRAFIEAKIGSEGLGTFCHRLLNESLAAMMSVQVISVFVLDKRNGDLRLRGQLPKRTDKRHLSDISIGPGSRSWLRKCFSNGSPIAEFDALGRLAKGQTIESDDIAYAGRLLWSIQLQFRSRTETQKRVKDRVLGVIRLSNPVDLVSGLTRPFHCFDGFATEFVAESFHNIVGSYVDRDVEGFDRDLAFHAAKTPAAGCLRNIKLAAQLLFDPRDVSFLDARAESVTPQFRDKDGDFRT